MQRLQREPLKRTREARPEEAIHHAGRITQRFRDGCGIVRSLDFHAYGMQRSQRDSRIALNALHRANEQRARCKATCLEMPRKSPRIAAVLSFTADDQWMREM